MTSTPCVLSPRGSLRGTGHSKRSVPIHVDHIVPLSKGGETTLDNLQVLCIDCNLGKGNRDDTDWRTSAG
ncbi:MAG: HNH endonuclease signature motif containing protein, partial [Planctomycetota bacterium]